MADVLAEGEAAPSVRPDQLDNILNVVLGFLVAAIIGLGAFFGYSIWANYQAELAATPALRLIEDLKQQVRENPNEPAYRVRLGEAFAAAGKFDAAVEQLENAIKLDENHSGAYMDLGLVAMITEDFGPAIRYFEKVLELTEGQDFEQISNRRDTALFNLGRIALQDGRYEDAIGFFKESLRIRKDASDTYYFIARAYRGLGEEDAAIEQLEIALSFDPNFAQAHFLMGEIYLAKDDPINASAFLFRASQLAPDADPPLEALESLGSPEEWADRARTALEQGDLDTAVNDVLVARNLNPDSSGYAVLHAEILLEMGDKDGALKTYEAALKLAPEDTSIQSAIDKLKGAE